jgi:hypothetical protein
MAIFYSHSIKAMMPCVRERAERWRNRKTIIIKFGAVHKEAAAAAAASLKF